MQTAHDEALQVMDMRLQQYSTFCAIEQYGDDDRIENAKALSECGSSSGTRGYK